MADTGGVNTYSRDSVFAEQSPDALYVPGGQTLTVTAVRDSEVALCTAPSKGGKAVRRIDGSTMRRSVRGKGSNTRYVCDILPRTTRPPTTCWWSKSLRQRDIRAVTRRTSTTATCPRGNPAGGNLLPPPEPAPGFCISACPYRRPEYRRGLRRGKPRRRDGSSRVSPLCCATWVRPVLPECHGRPRTPLAFQERPGPCMDGGAVTSRNRDKDVP